MDLVDEQHVALAELGEDGGEVAGAFEGGARGDVQVHAHLVGDDAGQRRLAEPGRPGEQQVVGGLAASAGGLEDDAQPVLQLGLADELVERPGPQRGQVGMAAAVDEVDGSSRRGSPRRSRSVSSGSSSSSRTLTPPRSGGHADRQPLQRERAAGRPIAVGRAARAARR